MTKRAFSSTFEKLKIDGGDEVIEELAKVFKDTNKKVNVALMVNKYFELYPPVADAV